MQGTRSTPYKVMIVMPKFWQEEIDPFIEKLLEKPALITGLLMRKLLPEVAGIAQDCGLKLFPSKWSDLKMNCNCPDWAVPCKHLASVIYMMSREIDNNPFLVFEIHGIHLLEELKKRGVDLDRKFSQVQPEKSRSLLVKDKKRVATRSAEESTSPAAGEVDFTSLRSLYEASKRMIPDEPPFYINGNFKSVYLEEIKRMASVSSRFLAGRLPAERLFPTPDDRSLHLTADSKVTLLVDNNLEWNAMLSDFDHTEVVDLPLLLQSVMAVNQDFIPDYDVSIGCLRKAAYTAIHLAANSLVKPEILKLHDGSFTVVWQPLPTDTAVAAIIGAIDAVMPPDMVKAGDASSKRPYRLENRAHLLVSELLTMIVHATAYVRDYTPISRMFFKGEEYKFADIGEKEIPGSIRVWCHSLLISQEQWWPVIYVADKSGDEEPFSLTLSVHSSEPDISGEVTLREVLNSGRWDRDRFDVLQSVLRLSQVIPDLDTYINNGAVEPVVFDDAGFVTFLTSVIPAMQMLGLKVYLPKSLEQLLRPKASLKIMDNPIEQGMFCLNDFFSYNWRVSIGDEMVDMDVFMDMVKDAERLIRFKKSYIYVSLQDLQKIRAKFMATKPLSSVELFQAALSGEYESAPVEISDGVKRRIEEFRSGGDVAVPETLKATLRPYQRRGFSWLYHNMKIGFGSILADDMGLGKTLQAITLMLKVKEEKGLAGEKVLVVAPVGLLYNWEAEIRRFAPTLTTHIYHGTSRNLKDAADADIVLTSYGMVRSDYAKIKKQKWQLMIIDEAQNIKNTKAAQTSAVTSVDAASKIALSGTPVENRLSEFWSIMNFANKGYLGTLGKFTTDFVKPIQMYDDIHIATRLKKITAPFLMRRMKTDKSIIPDLPDKVERDVYASLSPSQAALYQQTLKESMAIIEGMAMDSQQALFKRQGIILQMITALKQICDHPALFLKNDDTDPLLSGKSQLLLDMVQPIVEANDKVLIFTQYRQMGQMLQHMIAEQLGHRPLFYHGGCSVTERAEMVNKFQNSRTHQIFLISLKAGGTGLNLTAATNVIHYDLWWNPAVEAQATDRAYRIGQKRNVMVDRFITKGTFEERINDLINSKRHLAEMTVASGETWIGNLSNKELHDLFSPE